MKGALQNIDAYDTYRAKEIDRIAGAVNRYGIRIADQTIVDFGCNDGAISSEYLRRGAAKVFGVDIDEHAIQRAKDSHNNARLAFMRSTPTTIPLGSQSVDAVISYDVFEHVSQPRAILSELHRILAPNGQVLIGTWSWRHPFAPHLWSVMPVPWAHVFFSEKTMLRVCRRVYQSHWYVPNMHDFNQAGERLEHKYMNESIPTDYINKWLLRDFERAFLASGFDYKTHAIPFGSRYARWTKVLLPVPWLREFLAGYVWFVLTKRK
jgi:SAM-dependent methyltransferase